MDLGSSPGGWSQVAKELVGNSGKVFALDIIPTVSYTHLTLPTISDV